MENKNDWYAKGEYPPVGTVCEIMHGLEWRKTKIVAHHRGDVVFTTDWHDHLVYDGYINPDPNLFRPLETESNRLIEEAQKLFTEIDGGISISVVAAINVLSNAGMLKMPEEK